MLTPLLVLSIALQAQPPASNPPATGDPGGEPAAQPGATPAAPEVERVGGDREIAVEWRDGTWRYGRMVIEAPLPEGYPQPTPPGAIELKTYPSVRRAEYVGRGNSDMGMNFGFWPLFQHIKKRDIAMTSPVEMDYEGWNGELGAAPGATSGEWTMSFLYRTADLGPTGEDGRIRIVDTEPVTVLAIGLRGPYRLQSIADGMEALKAWLANHPEWEIAGDPRAFYYNGPSVRNADKWAEAQVPVKRKG